MRSNFQSRRGACLTFCAQAFPNLHNPQSARWHYLAPGAIIGGGDRKRAQISSIGAVPMIWDNNYIFRTNCAIPYGTRTYMLRGFLRMSRGGMASEIFHVFGPQLIAFTSAGILLLVSCSRLSEVRQFRI